MKAAASAATFLIAAVSFGAHPDSPPSTPCGTTVESLAICLSSRADGDTVVVLVKNDGPSDAVLDLGVVLANGAAQYPTALTLAARDPAGMDSQGTPLDPSVAAGRLDPFVLFLPRGAAMQLPLRLSRYQFQSTGERAVTRLVGGTRYVLRATLTARRPTASEMNLDVKGLALLSFWTGTVVSNAITVTPR